MLEAAGCVDVPNPHPRRRGQDRRSSVASVLPMQDRATLLVPVATREGRWRDLKSKVFNPPPNWPPPPSGWAPNEGWHPDPEWGPPPNGWSLWISPKRRRPFLTAVLSICAVLIISFVAVGLTEGNDDVGTRAAVAPSGIPSAASTAKESRSPKAHKTRVRWWPKGYKELDTGFAYRWLRGSEYRCGSVEFGCWGMSVIARDGCSDVYVELSTMNKNGVVIGFTNDTLGALRPMQFGAMLFEATEDGASTAQISRAICGEI
jgi:hypothetical protein